MCAHASTPTTQNTYTAIQMLAIITVLCFVKPPIRPFLPLADRRVRGDLFFLLPSIFGKGSDKLHSGILKCQLKMKINNLGVGKRFCDTVNITSTPGQTWSGPGAEWRLTGGEAGSHSRRGVPLFERWELWVLV